MVAESIESEQQYFLGSFKGECFETRTETHMISTSLGYDPIEDITTMLVEKDALDSIDELIDATKNYRLQLQGEILQDNVEDTNAGVNTNDTSGQHALSEFDIDKIFKEFDDTKIFATSTQNTIFRLTEGISHLDNAKKNLTQSMTLFHNLEILTDSYVQCKQLLSHNSFKEMTSSYRIMCSLADNTFASYKSVDDINKILTAVSRLKASLLDKIMNNYKKLLNGRMSENDKLTTELKEGVSELLESDPGSKMKLIDYCLDKLLYEITEIFQVDDEAGSLENLSRRYIFFKKVLNNFNSNFIQYFADDWDMPLKLTSRFYQMTKKDLKILLKREFTGKNPSIDSFMSYLQETLEFEKYIDVRFSRRIKDDKLSVSFEPYLTLWITHQDKSIKEKLLTYMSEPKTPENPTDSLVIPSSADLFRTYRSILSQTLELMGSNINESILESLAVFFCKWLNEYSEKILKPLLLPPNIEIQNKEEAIKYTLLLINTADYCSTTINQLEEKINQFNAESDKLSKIFMPIKNTYGDLLSKGNGFLLNRVIPLDLTYVWREFNNIDWAHIVIEDYSRYMVTLKNTLSFGIASVTSSSAGNITTTSSVAPNYKASTLESIVTQFNRDVYSWNFIDKIIDLVTHDFIGCIIRLLQPIPPFATLNSTRKLDATKVVLIGEQLLLDAQLLKEIFNSLLTSMSSDSLQGMSYKRVQRHVDNNIGQILKFIKLLIAPLSFADDYFENFKNLTDNNLNSSVWAFVLVLKGTPWDLALWKQQWSVFHLESDETNSIFEKQNSNDNLFIFQWQVGLHSQFQSNMLRIQDFSWNNFIRNDLKLSVPKRPIQNSHGTHQR